MRIYLAGAVAVEGRVALAQRALGTPQAIVLFVRLAAEPERRLTREELAEAIWPVAPPAAVDAALSALASRLRTVIRRAGADLESAHGGYGLTLPIDTWIDLRAADNAADEAEGHWRAGRQTAAWAAANIAVSIGERGLLPDHHGGWIEQRRARLRTSLRRGLHILSDVSARHGEATLAADYGERLVALEPFLETGYQQLMSAHASAGNRAAALRVYDRLRTLLRDELGTSPSPQTEAKYLQILRA
jgi:DNA-binding SARP family transcriptional activator